MYTSQIKSDDFPFILVYTAIQTYRKKLLESTGLMLLTWCLRNVSSATFVLQQSETSKDVTSLSGFNCHYRLPSSV